MCYSLRFVVSAGMRRGVNRLLHLAEDVLEIVRVGVRSGSCVRTSDNAVLRDRKDAAVAEDSEAKSFQMRT